MSNSELFQKENKDKDVALNELDIDIRKAYENDSDPVLEHDQVFNLKHEIIFSKKRDNMIFHRFTATKQS